MKLRDLYENQTCLVARYYKEASPDYDKQYNRVAAENVEKNQEYYKKYFEDGSTPVFKTPLEHSKSMSTKPEEIDDPRHNVSPGYKGLQKAKARAGLPYDKKVLR